MKNRIYKLFNTISIISLLFVIAACSDMNSSVKTPVDSAEGQDSFLLSGAITFKNGAFPGALVTPNSTRARAAIGGSTLKSDVTPEFTIEATQDSTKITGNVTKSGNDYNYSIFLTNRFTWTLKATYSLNNTVLGTGQTEITLPIDSQTRKPIQINFTPQITDGKKGGIDLTIKSTASNVSRIDWDWVDRPKNGEDPLDNQNVTLSSNTAEFIFDSVNSGSYKVLISFRDSAGVAIYSCYETINVFDDIITDTWYGNSPYFTDTNEFVVDDDVCSAFIPYASYMGINDGDPLYLLWNEFDYEEDFILYNHINATYGAQIFPAITEGMSVTDPLQGSINFCFDGTTLYVPPYSYRKSYAAYVKDPNFDLKSILTTRYPSLCANKVVAFPYSSMVLDGCLYFIFSVNDTQKDYYIGRYDMINDSLTVTQNKLNVNSGEKCTAFTVVHVKESGTPNPNKGILYYTTQSNSSLLYRKPFEIQTDGNSNISYFSFNDREDCVSNQIYINTFTDPLLDEDQYYLTGDLSVSDMIFVNNTLYVLVYITGSNRYYTYNGYGDVNESSSYDKVPDSLICNGGILKYNQNSDNLKNLDKFPYPGEWTSVSALTTGKKVLGLYTLDDSSNTNYYIGDEDTVPSEAQYKVDGSDMYFYAPVQPPVDIYGDPPSASTEYFYGPRKFLSASSTELVFIDDGGYVEEGLYGDSVCPVNRIVTLNLSTEALSFVNVNATFSAAYSSFSKQFDIYSQWDLD